MPGPHVQLATFCDHVLQEVDGTLSVIRAIDRAIVTLPAGAPAELPEGVVVTKLVLSLKSGDAQGRHPVTLRAQQPSGVYMPDQTRDVTFERDERGVNIVSDVALPAIEGLYWFEVLVNDEMLTRIPLRIMYQRIPGSP